MDRQLDISERLGERFLDLSESRQAELQDLWENRMVPLLEQTTEQQTAVAAENLANAREDRARYQDTYQPLEDNLIREFQEFDSGGRRALEAGRAMGLAQQTFDAQRANAEQRLASYGIDPSQLRAGAIDMAARTRLALNQAAMGNQARNRVEDMGRALRAEAINIGRGMPSQVAASYGQTLNAGNSAMGNTSQAVGQNASMLGTPMQYGQMAGNQNAQTMQGINNMYSGQLAGFNSAPDPLGALGNIAGQAFGAWAGSGFAEGGGAVGALPLEGSDLSPVPGPNDNIPVTLAEGEYIVPKDVVMRMGTEKLDKLIESTRKKAGEAGGRNAGVEPGQMPNPEAPIDGETLAAQGGGAVGYIPPMPAPSPVGDVPPAVQMSDPFAAYNAAASMPPSTPPPPDMGVAIESGAKLRENYDEGEGLPGLFRDWKARREAQAKGAEVVAAVPTSLG